MFVGENAIHWVVRIVKFGMVIVRLVVFRIYHLINDGNEKQIYESTLAFTLFLEL